jgi:MFS family permease
MSSAVVPLQAIAFSNITSRETGRASSLFSTNRQVAASFGTALLGTVLFQFLGLQNNQLFAYHMAFLAASVIGVIAIVLALTIHNKDAAASFKQS